MKIIDYRGGAVFSCLYGVDDLFTAVDAVAAGEKAGDIRSAAGGDYAASVVEDRQPVDKVFEGHLAGSFDDHVHFEGQGIARVHRIAAAAAVRCAQLHDTAFQAGQLTLIADGGLRSGEPQNAATVKQGNVQFRQRT